MRRTLKYLLSMQRHVKIKQPCLYIHIHIHMHYTQCTSTAQRIKQIRRTISQTTNCFTNPHHNRSQTWHTRSTPSIGCFRPALLPSANSQTPTDTLSVKQDTNINTSIVGVHIQFVLNTQQPSLESFYKEQAPRAFKPAFSGAVYYES